MEMSSAKYPTVPSSLSSATADSMTVTRTFSAKLFNSIANDPQVRPWLGGGSAQLDLSGLVKNVSNFAFQLGETGGFVVCPIFGQTYEVHTLFAPGDRDHAAIVTFMHQCIEWMFCRTEAVELVCRVPEGHLGAEWLSTKGGFECIGKQQDWDAGKSARLKRLWVENWAKNSTSAAVSGREFHELLAAAKEQADSKLPEHPDDVVHDSVVGAALLMARHGRWLKGTNMYNHWAAIAGYAQVQVVSEAPLVVDVGDALVEIGDDGLEVLLCR